MRVALVTNFCPHYRRPLYQELGRRMDLTLILTSRGREWYWEGDRPSDTGGVPAILATSPLKIVRELRSGGYDAVITDLTGRATLLATVGATRTRGLPLVLWVGIWEHPRTLVHRFSRPVIRRLYRKADALVVYGTHVSEYVARESGRHENVFVAHQAIDNEHFRTRLPATEVDAMRDRLDLDGPPTFTFAGRLTEEKGLDYLVDASAWAERPHRIVIAGTGPLSEAIRARASALGIEDRIRFPGYVGQGDLPALLQASDALVLPSVSTRNSRETWGLVVNEAMNSGLPVIATDAVGATAGGLVIDGKTGVVVPERDAQSLARAIDQLAADPETRCRLGEAARGRVLAWNFTTAADGFEAALAAAGVSNR